MKHVAVWMWGSLAIASLPLAIGCTDREELALQRSENLRVRFFDQSSSEIKLEQFLGGGVEGACFIDYTVSPSSLPNVKGRRLLESEITIPPGDSYFVLLIYGSSSWSQIVFRANEVGPGDAVASQLYTNSYCFKANVLYTNIAPTSRGTGGAFIKIERFNYVK